MITWSEQPTASDRDDDPYHAWAHERRNQQDNPTIVTAICPVMLEVNWNDDPDTFIANFKAIEALTNDPDVFISSAERALLQKKLAKLDVVGGSAEAFQKFYRRLTQIYLSESKLFPRSESMLQNTEEYSVLYIGRAIPNAVTGDVPRGYEAGAVDGQGTMLGIIDDSFAFLNDALTRPELHGGNPAQGSRFKRIFYQERERFIDGELFAGGLLEKTDIDEMLSRKTSQSEADVYKTAPETLMDGDFYPLDPTSEAHQPLAFPVSHGTHVTDTALRTYDAETGAPLTLFGVTVPTDVTQDTSGQSLGTYLINALRMIMVWADLEIDAIDSDSTSRPLVINFSYGYLGGSKDGSSEVNQLIAKMLAERNNAGLKTALVVPVGNSANDRSVAESTLAPEGHIDLDWIIDPGDRSDNFLELFAHGADLSIQLLQPGNPTPLNLSLDGQNQGEFLRGVNANGDLVAAAAEWASSAGSRWTRRGFVALGPTENPKDNDRTVPAGRWNLRITNTSATDPTTFLAMIQRDDAPGTYPARGRQSYLDHPDLMPPTLINQLDDVTDAGGPITKNMTASVFAFIDSKHVFAVGAGMGANGDKRTKPVKASPYASKGPHIQDGNSRYGPDVTMLADRSAYFRGIYGAGTYSGTEFAMSGGSVAVPQFAGYLAAHPELMDPNHAAWQTATETVRQPDNQFGPVLADG